MTLAEQPLVSCLMPTYNRRFFIPRAITYFLRQDYCNKELIILDDGEDAIRDLVPADMPGIRYYRLDAKINLGAKLNMACRLAKGNILVNWDDDDWYASWRLRYQVDSLLRAAAEVCGINQLLYYDLRSQTGFLYSYPADQRVWLLGSSLCFTRARWERGGFAEIDVGMDGLFVWATPPGRALALPDNRFAVHMIHDRNVSPKKTEGWWWRPHSAEEVRAVMEDDFAFYKDGVVEAGKRIVNVHACLVHERQDCVIDLVRNLHYLDPDSIILLYNGGQDAQLLDADFPFAQYRATIHPTPRVMQHGYLHDFALDCLAFALEQFEFDTLTIVDSDQLCLKKGYTAFLSAFFKAHQGRKIGVLSSKPARVDRYDKNNLVALQAFREYELWRPLIESFAGGEEKFVHWTFWPSTVFTRDAARDLVDLCRTNAPLQEIMRHSRIWASEEVILPTLVSMLGYEIVGNPCDLRYVNYKKVYNSQDLEAALETERAFFIHPIERRLEHPLRERVRLVHGQYMCKEAVQETGNQEPAPACPVVSGILDKIRGIEGWLSDPEAGLLIHIAREVCEDRARPARLVEVGSYHGKSTVILGSVAKEAEARVYAIDAHDGKQGAVDKGLLSFPPSWEIFQRNIRHAGLADVVAMSNDKSYAREWEEPVDLLLIDGLHDYFNVARDFRYFSESIVPGGYVAFHDHADYFPGVKLFVGELIGHGGYRKVREADSLVVLQKV